MKKLAALLVVLTTLATQAAAQCDTAENVLATSVTATTVNISFTGPSVHLYYVVKYNGLRQNVNDPGGPYPALISSPLSGLTPSTLYTFSIVAYCSPTDSSTGSNYTFTTPAAACDTVTGVTVSGITSSGATINATEYTFATSYTIYYVKNGYTDTVSVTGTDADFILAGLRYNTQYRYRIKSICPSGENSTSLRSFTTSPTVNYSSMSGFGYGFKRAGYDSTLNIPTQGTTPSIGGGKTDRAAVVWDTTGKALRVFDPPTQNFYSLSSNVGYVENIADLIAYTDPKKVVFVGDSIRGGRFVLMYNAAITADNGIYFAATGIGSGWLWQRDVAGARAFNIKWWGAKGEGISGYQSDSAAIENAIGFVGRTGAGAIYFPAVDSFYAYTGYGVLLPDNIEIFGDGAQSEIRYIEVNKIVTGYKGVIFFPSTYGPTNAQSIFKAPAYNIHDAAKGDSIVILDAIADTSFLAVGKFIMLGGNKFSKDADPDKFRYWQNDGNMVKRWSHDTVYLEFPLSDNITTDLVGGSPVIRDVNNGTLESSVGNFNGRGIKDHVSKNVHIHDLKLSQSMKNDLSGAPVTGNINGTIQLGGMFNSRLENLTIDGATGINGNMWMRTTWNNITLNVARNAIDMGYASSNSVFSNIKYTVKGFDGVTSAPTFIFINEASHDITLSNVTASGKSIGTNLLTIGNGAHNITVKDLNIDFRNTSNDNFGINISDGDTAYVHDVNIYNTTILMDTIGRWIRIAGNRTGPGRAAENRRVTISNSKFFGVISSLYKDGVFVNNLNGLTLDNVTFLSADTLDITNSDSSVFRNIKATNAYINISNSDAPLENNSFLRSAKTNLKVNEQGLTIAGGSDLVFVGTGIAPGASGAIRNTVVGNEALAALTSGDNNVAIGTKALNGKTTGSGNIGIGRNAALLSAAGDLNIFIGDQVAGQNTGGKNIILGSLAGYNNITGDNNTIIGNSAAGLPWNYSNALNIRNTILGFGMTVAGSEDSTLTGGRIAIGVLDSTARLTIAASTANYPSLKLAGGSTEAGSPADGAMWYNNSTNGFRFRINGTTRTGATLDGTESLSNKTFTTDILLTAATGIGSAAAPAGTIRTNILRSGTGQALQITANATGNAIQFSGSSTEWARFAPTTGNLLINTTTDVASAKVVIASTTQGFLPPRMTAAQASAISSPAEGLLVYVTDTNGTFTAKGWWGYDGAAWQKLNN